MTRTVRAVIALTACAAAAAVAFATPSRDVDRLVAALLGPTPLEDDLRALTDEIGGRPTGSPANARAVEWGLQRFRAAGVEASAEPFTMPALWLERSASARVGGDVAFEARVAAMPFSAATGPEGATAPLLDGGAGSQEDFARLGPAARGAFVLVETAELVDLAGLFREYAEATRIERRAVAAGAAGVVLMSSRPRNLLYRHNSTLAPADQRPMMVMEREAAQRAARLLRAGRTLTLTARLDLERGGPYEARNVVAQVRGTEAPQEVVLVGAHLDSWDLGTGALDNGCNAALVIDLARQIGALGLRPRRTVRFVLWNGEEQGMLGSWGYVQRHAAELDRHVLAAAVDIGSGRINGFFTGGRSEIVPVVDRALAPVASLGPFAEVDAPIVGTDNFDFMLEGVPNLVANQESANYGPNYHARSDTFDKVDLRQLRLNAAVMAAVVWAFASADVAWSRQSPAEVARLVEATDLKAQMDSMGLLGLWENGIRPRRRGAGPSP
ncbi:MAG: peptidase M28 [Acidobacteria bacterium]|nr:MAG: peptidase M28 [Acidobacteriota bacterium]